MSRDRYEDTRRVSLLVRNIPLDCRPEELRAKFERYGELRDVYLPRDYYTQRPKGFAFVEFRDARDAQEAIHGLDRSLFGGREISVVESKEDRKTPREMRRRDDAPTQRPSRGYGGGGGGGYGGGYDRGGDRGYGRGGDRGYDRGGDRGGYRERSRSPARRRSDSRSPPRRSSRRSGSRSPSPRRNHGSKSPSPRREAAPEYREKFPDERDAPERAPPVQDDGEDYPRSPRE